MSFWMDKYEVDGFCISGLFDVYLLSKSHHNVEHYHPADKYANYEANFHEILQRWKHKIDSYKWPRFLMLNVSSLEPQEALEYQLPDMTDLVLNENLHKIDRNCRGLCVQKLVMEWMNTLNRSDSDWPNFMVCRIPRNTCLLCFIE